MLHRRELLRVGALGAGLTLGQSLRLSAEESASRPTRSAITPGLVRFETGRSCRISR
jgi:hypothetical protein